MLLASSGAAFAEGDTEARDRDISAMPKGDAAQGEKLANKAYCYSCHGDKGQPLTQNAPTLTGFESPWIYATLVNYKHGLFNIDHKSDVMEAVVQPMSNQDMSDIAAYYGGFQRVAGLGDVKRPKKAKKCDKCHAEDEDDDEDEDDEDYVPPIAGQSSFYIERQLRAYHMKTRHTEDGKSMFKATKKLKSDKKIKKLSDYYAAQ